MVWLLLDKGADVNLKDQDGETALMKAARGEQFVQIGGKPVQDAALLFDERKIEYSDKTNSAKCGRSKRPVSADTVKLLLDKGADINAGDNYGEPAIMKAVRFGEIGLARTLRRRGAASTLTVAAMLDELKEIRSLIDEGVDVNAEAYDGLTPLMGAAIAGRTDAVKLLLENGANTNAKYFDGTTALVFAAIRGRVETVKLLLANGADVNAKTDDGMTPLILGAGSADPKITKLLLDKGADVNAKDRHGGTALMSAATVCLVDTMKLLLDKGADVNAKDAKGRTPFVVVLESYQSGDSPFRAAKLLLDRGADVNAKDAKGRTTLELRVSKRDRRIRKVFESHGAKKQ
jgi:ankyrin repeat protein